jgi:hypothetical protein
MRPAGIGGGSSMVADGVARSSATVNCYDEGEPSRGGPNLVLVLLERVFGSGSHHREESDERPLLQLFRPAPFLKRAK